MNTDLVTEEGDTDQTNIDLVSDGDSDQMKTDLVMMATLTK